MADIEYFTRAKMSETIKQVIDLIRVLRISTHIFYNIYIIV